MSTKIEQMIDEIEDYIESCKPKMLSSNMITVNKDDLLEMLRELRMKTPDEIKRYQKIISNRDAILSDARAKAESLINEAAIHTNQLVSETEIMQQSQERAQEIIESASAQAQEILDQAAEEANAMRAAAVQYTDSELKSIENVLSHAVDVAALNYEKLIAQLNEDLEVISSNRAQLYPQEAMPAQAEQEPGVDVLFSDFDE